MKKITDEERSGKGVTGLADTPELETLAMQQKFDELGNMGIDAHNYMVDELTSDGSDPTMKPGAEHIGVRVPDGIVALANLQAVLESMSALIVAGDSSKHTHDNKVTLDGITAAVKAGYDALVSKFQSIISVDSTTVSNSPNAVPSSAAVTSLLASYNYTSLKNAIFPVGAVVLNSTGINPSTYIGGTWNEIYDLFGATSGVYAFRRTS